ncbi:hypothetical protein IKQ26_00285 [bacterium]|nr:hypothetical protein [bacterium]
MKNLYDEKAWSDISQCQRIGEILIESGKINLKHLSLALGAQKFQKLPLGEIFVAMNAITREDLEQALHIQKCIAERINKNA